MNSHSQRFAISIFLINLPRRKDRLEAVCKLLKSVGFPLVKIDAIDGQTEAFLEKHVDVIAYSNFMGRLPNKGTIACSLSHFKAWKDFIASTDEYALICEDDIIFDPTILRDTVISLTEQKHLWDVVNFENHHRSLHLNVHGITANLNLVFFLTRVTHAGCYLINRYAAQTLVKNMFPIKRPVDHYFTRIWEHDYKFCGVLPNIVKQKMGESDICHSDAICEKKARRWWLKIKRLFFDIVSEVTRIIYSAKHYLSL